MKKERILITVKTYPTLSNKYGETVCTAGVREDGSWVRMYPVPFRRLDEPQQYKKYDWVECTLLPNDHDPRTETRRPADFAELKAAGHVDTADGWRVRRDLLLKKARVYTRLEQLLDGARANTMSLAVFKPTEVLDFKVEEDERDWDPQKVERMRALTSQMDLFEDNAWRETFKLIPKLPYSFSYRFTDADGRESTLQILDWEIGALFWNCVRSEKGDEKAAIAKVRHKYMTEFLRKDIHFFLGTTLRWHSVAPNPWLIIGVLPIPKERQLALL